MAKIPFYDDRLTPQGGLNVQARFAEQTTAADQALQNLGNAGSSAGAILMKIENDNAIANTSKPLAEMPGWGQKTLQDLATKSTDGGYVTQDDGSRVTLTDAFRKSWDDQATKMLAGITNPAAKEYASKHLASTYQSLNTASIQTEYKLLQQNKSDSFDTSVAAMARDVAGNDKLLEQRLQDMDELGKRLGFDEHTRNTKILVGKRSIVESAVQGAIQRNAPEVAEAIKQHYGVSAEAQPMRDYPNLTPENKDALTQTAQRLGIAPSNLAAIISYETGGTFNPGIRGGAGNKHIGLIQFGENEQKAYGANQQQSFSEQLGAVERYLKDRGVRAGDDLTTLYKIVNGGNRNISGSASDGNGTIDEHVAKIAADHGGSTMKTSAVPVSKAVQVAVANLEPDRVNVFMNEANATLNKQQTVMRGQVTAAEGDHVTAWMNGQDVQQPLTEQQYVQAFGAVEGPQRYANYQAIAAVSSDINALKMMPVADQQAVIDKYKPDPSKPGYELATKRYDAIVQAQQKLNTERAQDPHKWAQSVGLETEAIDWNLMAKDPNKLGLLLSGRSGITTTMHDKYGTPLTLLSKAEAANLSAGLNTMTAEAKLSYFGMIANSVKDPVAQQSIFNQIMPDSPATAIAGKLFTIQNSYDQRGFFGGVKSSFNPQQVASMIVKGEAILNPTKADKESNGKTRDMIMPKEADLQTEFNNQVGGLFVNQPKAAQNFMQVAKDYYAASMAQAGNYSGIYDGSKWAEAIQAVAGGIYKVNGGQVMPPWGMPEEAFKDSLKGAFDAEIKRRGMSGPTNEFFLYQFENNGGDSYLIRRGSGYLRDNEGNPIAISLGGQPVNPGSTGVAPMPAAIPRPVLTQPKTK